MAASEGGPVRLNVQASVHATEDFDRVKTAIENLFPQAIQSLLKFKTTSLRGHYHNPILRIEIQLTHPDQIVQTLTSIGQKLTMQDRVQIDRTFASRIDQKGQLFLRIDKQEAYQGRIRIINRGDSIRIVIRFAGRKPSLKELKNYSRQFKLI